MVAGYKHKMVEGLIAFVRNLT